MHATRFEQVDNVCDGLQVTLEFALNQDTVLSGVSLRAKVKEVIGPILARKVLVGEVFLENIHLVDYPGRGGNEIVPRTVSLSARWRAHLPWWAEDNHDWDKVPFQSRPLPDSTHIT